MRNPVAPPSPPPSESDDPDAAFSRFYWWRSLQDPDGSAAPSPPTPARLRVVKELERLALVAHESLDELRHRLLGYRAGDLWFPAGGISRQETDIPPVITVLLLGFAGSGKSSLVNLMYSVLGRSGFVPFAQTSSPAGKQGRTEFLEEHNVLRSMHNGFCVFDSRGLDYDRMEDGLQEVSEWMDEGVRHRQPCHGAGPSARVPLTGPAAKAAKRFVQRCVNCVMLVLSLSEIYWSYTAGDFRPLEAARELFHAPSVKNTCNDNPILVLTHGDELTTEQRIDGRVKICEYLGISETTGVYDIMCLHEQGTHGAMVIDEMDPVNAYALTEAMYRALLIADRSHPPKPNVKDWLLLILSWSMCSLSAFFAFLAYFCSKLAKAHKDHHKLK
ncbi:putative P-loop containing nucleoside triphosphate hydrolase [Dioscorea sansibarensis]